MVNRVGASFVHDTVDKTGFSASDVARAYAITRDAFDLRAIWRAIEGLDYKISADQQTAMMLEVGRLVERAVYWFLRNGRHPLDVAGTAKEFRPGIASLAQSIDAILPEARKAKYHAQAESLMAKGVPAELARRVSCLCDLSSACDIVRIARGSNHAIEKVGAVYFAIGGRLGLDWLRAAAADIKADTAWQKMAVDAIIDDLFGHQGVLAGQALECGAGAAEPGTLIDVWLAKRTQHVARTDALLGEFRAAPGLDLAMLAVANRQLRTIAT
jgi:glutamate dehydrogenase